MIKIMESNLQLFENNKLELKVRTILNKDESISISAEDTAIGFGWYQVKDGKQYPKWERMNGFIKDLGFSPQVGKSDYIPESLFYMLGMKANNKIAIDFQLWLAKEVIPSIRKNGVYIANHNLICKMKEDLVALMDAKISKKIDEIESKCSTYYKPSCATKYSIGKYIKQRLGIDKANGEYELVKQRILIILGGRIWEDIPMDVLSNSMKIIDESIEVIKKDRPYKQVTMFEPEYMRC